MSRGLRLDQMHEGMEVGLREGGGGARLHGTIHSFAPDTVRIWVPDLRYSTALPRALRGFLTALTYPQAEAGALWSEPMVAQDVDTAPTGRDLLAYWEWARKAGIVSKPTSASYLHGARTILEHLPHGLDTDLSALDLKAAISGYSAAHAGELAASTIAQYTSAFRRAVTLYLHQRTGEEPGTVRTRIALPDGRTVTVIAPADLPDAANLATSTLTPTAAEHLGGAS